MCTLVCVCMCAAQRDAWLPIDVIIFHFQALISAWVAEVFLLFCLCFFCVCAAVHAHAHMEECMVRGGMFLCAIVCGCELHKMSVSLKVAHTFLCFLLSWKVRKISFPTQISATKTLRHMKCHCWGNQFKSVAQIQSFISFLSKVLN